MFIFTAFTVEYKFEPQWRCSQFYHLWDKSEFSIRHINRDLYIYILYDFLASKAKFQNLLKYHLKNWIR